MFYLMGQILVCLMLTAIISLLAGWLARGFNARAEIAAVKRQAQLQARDLRARAESAERSAREAAAAGSRAASALRNREAEAQLREEMDHLKSLLNQRNAEIAQLRQVLGEQRRREGSAKPRNRRRR